MTPSLQSTAGLHEHFVQFYEKDAFLIDEVSAFIGSGLKAGQAGIVIATPPHREDLERRLRAHGLLPGGSFHPDPFIALDAAETLSRFMVDGQPDPQRFTDVLGSVIRRATQDGSRQVRAFGEMVALLWAEGRHAAAIRLEELWDELIRAHSLSLLCAYPMEGFHDEEHGGSFLHICNAHSQVRPAESFLETATPDELRRQIARLQQKAAALETEVVKRRQAEQALRQRERELTDFLENAVEGLHKVGADGTVLWANKAELDMLGYEPEEYIGRPITDFHADREVICDILDRLQRGESLYACPARLRCKDGSIKHVEIHSNVLFDGGEFVHTRCFTRDVTERVRLETELQRKIEQLAETDRRKDEFLAMLGHELRNPMAAIVTATELMRLSGDNPAHVARAREIVARQSALMARLIDDLLDVSRITRGKIELKTETVLLGSIVERAVESVRPLIDERGHRLTVDLPAEPVSLLGDAARLGQVLANLLHNAAKYTDPGGNLALSARTDGTDLLISVRDDGVGMTPELCEKVFDLFVQAPSSLDRARGGLGIGLTLVRTLVELHGGSIQARSDGPGRGCEFIVRLPLRQAAPAGPQETVPAHAALV
ncbi:MAG TPA: ATP-binding protein [Thermoanaerobaculia bacterium]|jgi:PAS domain S-box-containing protein|nr:ATP-binding protein [Thermoanaerobaculia bacterium]